MRKIKKFVPLILIFLQCLLQFHTKSFLKIVVDVSDDYDDDDVSSVVAIDDDNTWPVCSDASHDLISDRSSLKMEFEIAVYEYI